MKLLKTSISIFITSLLLCGNAFAKPDDKPPIEVDVFVVNGVGDPIPVTVHETTKVIVWGRGRLNHGSEAAHQILWRRADGNTSFSEVPSGHILLITDVLVSHDYLLGDIDQIFNLSFWRHDEGGRALQFTLGGLARPFSHSFTAPFVIEADHGLTLVADVNVISVLLTGYLTIVP